VILWRLGGRHVPDGGRGVLRLLWRRWRWAGVSDAVPKVGEGHIEEVAQPQLLHLRSEGAKPLRHHRQQRGRTMKVEGPQRVVRCRDERAQAAEQRQRDDAEKTDGPHVGPLPGPGAVMGLRRVRVIRIRYRRGSCSTGAGTKVSARSLIRNSLS